MPFCTNCGAEINDKAKFCSECGSAVAQTDSENRSNTTRQQEYIGTVRKCPACGEEIPSLTAFCPSCGHEIVSDKVNTSLKAFTDTIDECDRAIAAVPTAKKGWQSWSKKARTWWVVINVFLIGFPIVLRFFIVQLANYIKPSLSEQEQRKTSVIENYTFPNERESILESLLFIRSKMDFLSSRKVNRQTKHWADVWYVKAEQIKEKTSILFQGSTDDQTINKAYEDIEKDYKNILSKINKRIIIGALLLILYITSIFLIRSANDSDWFELDSDYSNKDSVVEQTEDLTEIEWPTTGLSPFLPVPKSLLGEIKENTPEEFSFRIKCDQSEYYQYKEACIEKGFTAYPSDEKVEYKAYNQDRYYLELSFSYSFLEVKLEAPEKVMDIKKETFKLAAYLPTLNQTTGKIENNTQEELSVDLDGYTSSGYAEFIEKCIRMGYTIDQEMTDDAFVAFQKDGYKLEASAEKFDVLRIHLTAPYKMTKFRWSYTEIANTIPKPKSKKGYVYSDSDSLYIVYIANTDKEAYLDYIDACVKKGYNKDISRYDDTFYASNSFGDDLQVSYEGFNTMRIDVSNFSR